jgi:hypothetical protein
MYNPATPPTITKGMASKYKMPLLMPLPTAFALSFLLASKEVLHMGHCATTFADPIPKQKISPKANIQRLISKSVKR